MVRDARLVSPDSVNVYPAPHHHIHTSSPRLFGSPRHRGTIVIPAAWHRSLCAALNEFSIEYEFRGDGWTDERMAVFEAAADRSVSRTEVPLGCV